MAKELYIGAMSGTSLDGLDIAICELDMALNSLSLITATTIPFPQPLREALFTLCHTANLAFDFLYQTEQTYSQFCAEQTAKFLKQHKITTSSVTAYGFHGQTIRHHPDKTPAYTLQIGDLSRIAAVSGLLTVGDFRRKDVALGGQGAPFAPAFHQSLFSTLDETRVIANIGGISNISILSGKALQAGFDTGPGNALMDGWFKKHHRGNYDASGMWARQGTINQPLLQLLLDETYFQLCPPKSTGRELFNDEWLEQKLHALSLAIDAVDVQTTLTELTAHTLASAIMEHAPNTDTIYVCGGGSHNNYLLERLAHLSTIKVCTTESLGIHPDWIEAAAFAWLAANRLHKKPIELAHITGAQENSVLGGVYEP